MKHLIITPENPNGVLVDLTSQEITQRDQDAIEIQTEQQKIQNKADLKASAKTKLMNGEALTEDEANVMVGL